mgnify:CR=1 FL=1
MLALCSAQLLAQDQIPVNGAHNRATLYEAFTHATIYTDHENQLEDATLLIHKGKVVAVGKNVAIPKGTMVHDMQGKYIYPSWIDMNSQYGLPDVPKNSWKPEPQFESKKQGAYAWNEAIKTEFRAAEVFVVKEKDAEVYLSKGFGVVLSHQKDGIARGTSVLATLGNGNERQIILKTDAANHFSFRKGSSRQSYPSSQMGSIALLRQSYLDAQWYATQDKQQNLSLAALNNNSSLPQIFEVHNKQELLRADKIGDEFGIQYIISSGGDAYQRIDEIKASGATLIVPLNFPNLPDVEDPYDAAKLSLGRMKHWEMAPANPAMIANAKIPFVLSTHSLKKKEDFLPNLRKAISFGLSEAAALKALTTTPAKLLKASDQIGSLDKGKWANFFVSSTSIFDDNSKMLSHWIKGEEYRIHKNSTAVDPGKYTINLGRKTYDIDIKGTDGKYKINFADSTITNSKLTVANEQINIRFFNENQGAYYRLTAHWNNTAVNDGYAILPDESKGKWSMKLMASAAKPKKKESKKTIANTAKIQFPNKAYGLQQAPSYENIIFTNATLWTNEKEGIIENSDIAISGGKIIAVGQDLNRSVFGKIKGDVKIIDAKGKHISSGIIDEHSHIAINNGVNESGQSVTAEVSIADVVNADDINIYRQLAGGVTTSQLLHGSANPIGGQSAIIKLRWGKAPEEMKFENADGFIKFALGENVKQTNWGDYNTSRFPQTRMGVEQVYYDAFIRARDYEKTWKAYNKLSKKQKRNSNPPRKDLELDVLVEILNSTRFITCHSYIQSEINMLMHVADSMGFRINTFTHILEGYKVADKMREHGVGGSTFSDWWAYKYEVNDAIPYNGALLHEAGIVTAFNSDDAEMARRLNQEAAKAVKYGGVSEEDAWKFVTLNPAKLLHIDDRVGSLQVGKDADIVIWSDNPLSIYAIAEQTYIDGRCYFSLDTQKEMEVRDQKERSRLIQKMLVEKHGGASTTPVIEEKHHLYHCDTLEEH